MASKPMRVLRAYSLPVELFDHLKNTQRRRQADIDRRTGKVSREGDENWVTTSEAMSGLVFEHRWLTSIAERAGLTLPDFINAAVVHGLTVQRHPENTDALTVGTISIGTPLAAVTSPVEVAR